MFLSNNLEFYWYDLYSFIQKIGMFYGCSFIVEFLYFFFYFVLNDFDGCGKNNKVYVLVLILII